jgi:hypothetical protein
VSSFETICSVVYTQIWVVVQNILPVHVAGLYLEPSVLSWLPF